MRTDDPLVDFEAELLAGYRRLGARGSRLAMRPPRLPMVELATVATVAVLFAILTPGIAEHEQPAEGTAARSAPLGLLSNTTPVTPRDVPPLRDDRFGLRPDEAVAVDAPPATTVGTGRAQPDLDLTSPWTVVPGSGGTCVFFTDGAACTTDLAAFAKRGLIARQSGGLVSGDRPITTDRSQVIRGITPDGIVSVRVVKRDGGTIGSTQVFDNRFAVVVNGFAAGDYSVELEHADKSQPLEAMQADPSAKTLKGTATSDGGFVTRLQQGTSTCVTAAGGGHCGDDAELAIGHGLVITACDGSMPRESARVFGALPLGTTSADAVTGDGRKWNTDVVNATVNFEIPFSNLTSGKSLNVRWIDDGQPASTNFYIPPDLAAGCDAPPGYEPPKCAPRSERKTQGCPISRRR